jgi:hypothetical protein
MKKIILKLLVITLLLSLVLVFSAQLVGAGTHPDTNPVTITKTGELVMVKDADPNSHCYHYVINYTYVVTSSWSEALKITAFQDSLITDINAFSPTPVIGTLFSKNVSRTFTASYPVPFDKLGGFVENQLTIYAAYTSAPAGGWTAISNKLTTYIPQYSTPDAWYLNYENSSGGLTSPLEMKWVANNGTRTQGDGVTLGNNQTQTWLSNQAAGGDTTYPADKDWTLLIHTPSNWGTAPEIKVGEWDAVNNQISGPAAIFKSWTWDMIPGTIPAGIHPNFTHTIILQSNAQIVVHSGKYLALQIKNKASGNIVIVTCNKVGGTCLQPPEGIASQSVPELPAGILFGVGLAGIGGFILIKRRSKVSSTK